MPVLMSALVAREGEKMRGVPLSAALKVQSEVLRATTAFLHGRGFVQLLPVMISPITDPLNHAVVEAGADYYGSKFQFTRSMILHKQLAVGSAAEKLFILSPNVRLESPSTRDSGRHLLEFSQVDFEWRSASQEQVMRLTEEMFSLVFSSVAQSCAEPLRALGRRVRVPRLPFETYWAPELEAKYGPDWEALLSKSVLEPVWVLDHAREFYDKEDPSRPGHYRNYDVVYPEGFGEGLSGAEREWELGRILERMRRKGMDVAPYAPYLEAAKQGLLQPSAGAGFGVERMVRFLCGFRRIEECTLFAKVPGADAYAF